MRQERTLYRTDVLCRLSGRSRPAYYERLHYVATQGTEENTVLSPVREVRKDFPRMGAGKLPVYFQPQFEAMHIHIGRDTFIELQYRNFMPVRRNGNRRKTTLSNHRMHRCPYLTVDYTPVSPNRLRTGDITYIEAEDGHGCLQNPVFRHRVLISGKEKKVYQELL
jgi:hypothetical protein